MIIIYFIIKHYYILHYLKGKTSSNTCSKIRTKFKQTYIDAETDKLSKMKNGFNLLMFDAQKGNLKVHQLQIYN